MIVRNIPVPVPSVILSANSSEVFYTTLLISVKNVKCLVAAGV